MDNVDDIIAHYGVKGMKWGVRRTEAQLNAAREVRVSQKPGRKVQTAGGRGLPASEDAKRAAVNRQKAKASTTDALSTKELQELVNRLQLEANYARLSTAKKSAGRQFVEKLFKDKNARTKASEDISTILDVATTPLQVGAAIRKTDLSKIGK